ncbi:uncharacterized protein TRIADDRAFT_56128 [Trichoplax adhaerens]|uniref:G-protein coupled receptors family 1 profile domain-containing protein n=1 Tax=Trichoplax adhaerens TaxID=10228 RepID=B3RX94_TRIAD|nr:hypothetical protein TRIADDRAFT_56128 [Trichoplax adhaerens]EDV24377.1 hypothetical protein TRIADDRAFT_56128 [Trichoplax adhaerens]|eukprot:XP_002112267.1 hypothetical protein TRIADDRAFT_56128 [Trichoplax adhaerens]
MLLQKKLMTVTEEQIVSLAISDMLYIMIGSGTQLLIAFATINNQLPIFLYDSIACRLLAAIQASLAKVNVYTMTLISVTRYAVIVKPIKYQPYLKPRYNRIVLAIIFTLSFGLSILPVFQLWGKYQYSNQTGLCFPLSTAENDPAVVSYEVTMDLTFILIPSVIMFFSYFKIILLLRLSRRQITSYHNNSTKSINASNSTNTLSATSSIAKVVSFTLQSRLSFHRKNSVSFRSSIRQLEYRLTKTIMLAFIVFLISYFPHSISCTLALFGITISSTTSTILLHLTYVNGILGPLIYITRSARVRQSLRCNRRIIHVAH